MIEYRSYVHFNTDAFIKDLKHVPWFECENESNVDDAVLTWNKLFTSIADAHAPIKRRRVCGNKIPWMTSKIREAMRDRDYHHRKAIKSSSNYHWKMYKKLRNYVNREIKSSKSKFYVI